MPQYHTSVCNHPTLSPYIEGYLQLTGPGHPSFKYVQPRPGAAILFDFKGLTFNECTPLNLALAGLHTRPYAFRTLTEDRDAFIIKFSPYGLSRWIDTPASGLTDRITDAADFFGKDIQELYSSINGLDFRDRIQAAEAFFAKRMHTAPSDLENCIFKIADNR